MDLKLGEKKINPINVGYLPAIAMKEILAGRGCRILGGVNVIISSQEGYERNYEKMAGRFGEILRWDDGGKTAVVATRNPPEWAVEILEREIWDAPAMLRWAEMKGKI